MSSSCGGLDVRGALCGSNRQALSLKLFYVVRSFRSSGGMVLLANNIRISLIFRPGIKTGRDPAREGLPIGVGVLVWALYGPPAPSILTAYLYIIRAGLAGFWTHGVLVLPFSPKAIRLLTAVQEEIPEAADAITAQWTRFSAPPHRSLSWIEWFPCRLGRRLRTD